MSGKMARRLRKSHSLSKKTLAICAGLCLSSTPLLAKGQFLVSIFPHITKPLGEAHNLQYGLGAGAKLTYRPVKFLNLFAQGDYLSMALPGTNPVSIMQGSIGTGYHVDLSSRFSLDFNINAGVYNAKSSSSISGFSAGGSLVFTYKISPTIYLDVDASATHYAAGKTPLMMANAAASPGLTFNITEFFNSETKVNIETKELAPVFPVLYSWYEHNSFGKVDVINDEDGAITNVTVSFFQPQYMAHAKECATINKIKKGESVSVDLLAFFNEQMLELREKTDTNCIIIVNYSYLGQKRTKSIPLTVPVYGRNNMSWDDDRRAAVFVSSKDPAAMQFAKYTASVVRDNLHTDIPVNIQYAIGIFETLNQFGLNYVVDPSSAFADNIGTSSIDFLQFPYQTLMYRGGDCDDISILVCSLFEAAGIETAFITIPGHIFMAFNAGITPEQARESFQNISNFIIDGDEVWVPLEITLSDEGFYKACRVGAREWNTANANGTAALYKMRDSWKIYQPISVPGANAYLNIPEEEIIYLAFELSAREWSSGEIRRGLLNTPVQYVIKETENTQETETVIKNDPLSPSSLKDIVSLASNVVALTPAAIREEELEDYDEEESIDDILPLDMAIATVLTDVPVRYNQKIEDAEAEDDVSNLTFEERLAKAELRNSRNNTIELTASAANRNQESQAVEKESPEIATVEAEKTATEAPIVTLEDTAVAIAEPETVQEPEVDSKETFAAVEKAEVFESSEEPEVSEASDEPAVTEVSVETELPIVTPEAQVAEITENTKETQASIQNDKQKSNITAIAISAAAVTATAIATGLVINARKKKRDEEEK